MTKILRLFLDHNDTEVKIEVIISVRNTMTILV
jgi:hypothetical protein